ncbi:restriction endonuclease subunit S [Bacteroides sp.]
MVTDNNNKVLNVPTLRFPEFKDEWEINNLAEIANFIGGGTPSSSNLSFWNGSIPWISSSDIKEDDISNISTTRFITEEAIKKSATKLCPAPVILLVSRVGVGKVALSRKELCTSQDFCNIVDIQCNPTFLAYNLLRIMKRKSREVQGTSIKGITSEEIQKIKLRIPKKDKEQNKIAHFLSLLDKRIATQNKIIEDLKKIKSAIINSLYANVKGKTYQYNQILTAVNERNKRLDHSNVLSASQELGMVERNDLNIDIKYEQNSISSYKIVRKGDYVSHLRSFQGGFAFSELAGVCSPAYTVLRPNAMLEQGYLSHFFTSKGFINSLKLVTYGIRDGRSINISEWLEMNVIIPLKEQQQRTLSIINSFNSKLSNEEFILSALNIQKKYLLQQMFI